jgi:hypothetical protein
LRTEGGLSRRQREAPQGPHFGYQSNERAVSRVKDLTTAVRRQNDDTLVWSHPIEKNTPRMADDLHFL